MLESLIFLIFSDSKAKTVAELVTRYLPPFDLTPDRMLLIPRAVVEKAFEEFQVQQA